MASKSGETSAEKLQRFRVVLDHLIARVSEDRDVLAIVLPWQPQRNDDLAAGVDFALDH